MAERPFDPFAAAAAQTSSVQEPTTSEATVVSAVPEQLLRATAKRTGPATAAVTTPAVPLPAAGPPPNPEDAHFTDVYNQFLATRAQCNEPADGLTFDKFVLKLRKNKEQLVEKYKCKSVRFQVYVKDGKAALKATPVRD